MSKFGYSKKILNTKKKQKNPFNVKLSEFISPSLIVLLTILKKKYYRPLPVGSPLTAEVPEVNVNHRIFNSQREYFIKMLSVLKPQPRGKFLLPVADRCPSSVCSQPTHEDALKIINAICRI